MTDCIFCKIIDGDIPSSKIYEDEHFLAFLDIKPINKGHALIIPKKHYEKFNEIPTVLLSDFIKVVQRVSVAVMKATNAPGYNIFINNHKTAGQEVLHSHFHVVPRYENDFTIKWPSGEYSEGEMGKMLEELKKHI